MKHSLYGTVYNNGATVEKAIRSAYRPEYEIVVVDAGSTDGTYEKLMGMRQEFNLTVFRLRCSRGKGRDYALRRCQDGAMTAYIDLDVEYNENLHRLMSSETSGMLVNVGQWTYFVKKEDAVRSGGWKDLNSTEDVEFFLRNGITRTVSAVVGYNERAVGREKRYQSGLGYYRRVLGKTVDRIRGEGLGFSEVNPTSVGLASAEVLGTGPLAGFLCKSLYVVAAAKGTYRVERNMNNRELFIRMMLGTIADPRDFGIGDADVLFPFRQLYGVSLPDEEVMRAWGAAYKYSCSSDWTLYVKTPDALRHLTGMPEFGCESPSLIAKIPA